MRLKMGRITVKNLITYSYHGCYSEENEIGSKYKIDIWVEGDFESAEKNDSLENTVDYVALTDVTAKEWGWYEISYDEKENEYEDIDPQF